MNFLIDHNLERYAVILLGKIATDGWLELIPIRFITFKEIELSTDSSDRRRIGDRQQAREPHIRYESRIDRTSA